MAALTRVRVLGGVIFLLGQHNVRKNYIIDIYYSHFIIIHEEVNKSNQYIYKHIKFIGDIIERRDVATRNTAVILIHR